MAQMAQALPATSLPATFKMTQAPNNPLTMTMTQAPNNPLTMTMVALKPPAPPAEPKPPAAACAAAASRVSTPEPAAPTAVVTAGKDRDAVRACSRCVDDVAGVAAPLPRRRGARPPRRTRRRGSSSRRSSWASRVHPRRRREAALFSGARRPKPSRTPPRRASRYDDMAVDRAPVAAEEGAGRRKPGAEALNETGRARRRASCVKGALAPSSALVQFFAEGPGLREARRRRARDAELESFPRARRRRPRRDRWTIDAEAGDASSSRRAARVVRNVRGGSVAWGLNVVAPASHALIEAIRDGNLTDEQKKV
ncbi:hypothetical protein JL720_9738 [Aureococcus anophagefferens]|nr:hypothetical protein JL720_9738 [Aureococcus anophagefferens]